jgi:hypothetical protein
MNKKNISAPAKLMKSKHNPKSEFHTAVSKILNIINNLQYENDKKKIDKVYNAKYPKDLKMPSDTYLLNKIYIKPRRKFTITDIVPEKKPESKTSSSKLRRKFTITDIVPEKKPESKTSSSKLRRKLIITISNPDETKIEKNIITGAKTNSKNLNYKIIN